MAKLYATLENSKGKTVSVSDNEEITATLYDGNMRAYSVIISFGDIGDIIDNDGNDLRESEKTKGAIITHRECRNEPDEKRKVKATGECSNGGKHRWYKPYINEDALKCSMCDRVKATGEKCKFCGHNKFITDNEGDKYCENPDCEMYK